MSLLRFSEDANGCGEFLTLSLPCPTQGRCLSTCPRWPPSRVLRASGVRLAAAHACSETHDTAFVCPPSTPERSRAKFGRAWAPRWLYPTFPRPSTGGIFGPSSHRSALFRRTTHNELIGIVASGFACKPRAVAEEPGIGRGVGARVFMSNWSSRLPKTDSAAPMLTSVARRC